MTLTSRTWLYLSALPAVAEGEDGEPCTQTRVLQHTLNLTPQPGLRRPICIHLDRRVII